MDRTDRTAELESLLRTHHAALVAMLERRIPRSLRGSLGAEDVAQEAALEAFRSIGRFQPAGEGSLRRWLWQIARHRLSDAVKARRRIKRGSAGGDQRATTSDESVLDALPCAGPCPAGAADRNEIVAAVRAALAGLGDSYRQAVQLRFVEGLSVHEAAARLGRTPAALLVLCSRALKLLRRRMERPGPAGACPHAA